METVKRMRKHVWFFAVVLVLLCALFLIACESEKASDSGEKEDSLPKEYETVSVEDGVLQGFVQYVESPGVLFVRLAEQGHLSSTVFHVVSDDVGEEAIGCFVKITFSSKEVPYDKEKPERILADEIVEWILTSADGEYLRCRIAEVVSPDLLIVYPDYQTQKFGKTIYITTEDADQWCVGDYVRVTYVECLRSFGEERHTELLASEIQLASLDVVAKPIIYLYPEAATECSVKLTLDGELTVTYPEHGAEGWQGFVAYPDGTLVFPDGKEYYALYWEGVQSVDWDFSRGFCVKGEDTVAFLEWALAAQGLNRREANEFIVYWLPLMKDNAYNVISFQTTAYTDGAVLTIDPAPDSLLRIFMTYYPSDTLISIEPQEFVGFEREGFTVVEWGGSSLGSDTTHRYSLVKKNKS